MIVIILALGSASFFLVAATSWRWEHAREQQRREAVEIDRAAQAQHEMIGDYVGGYTWQLKPWWGPEERHAFGYDDNEQFIRETQRTLDEAARPAKRAAWRDAWQTEFIEHIVTNEGNVELGRFRTPPDSIHVGP